MATQIQVTQQDIDGLASKLDEFATVLTARERAILHAVLGMAGKEIEDVIEHADQPSQPTSGEDLPSLSSGFRAAFAHGVGTKFTFEEDESEGSTTKVKAEWAQTSML